MKWFKHLSSAHTDIAIRQLIEEFGMEGYGLYWLCCELVAQQGNHFRLKKNQNWVKIIELVTKIPSQRLTEMLQRLADLNLIHKASYGKGHIYIKKMSKYADDYTDSVVRRWRQGSDSVPLDKNRIDKNRIDKNRVTTDPSDLKLSQLLYDLIKKNYPNWYRIPSLEVWADDVRKLREIDKQAPETIEKVIKWCQNDHFWAKNILSTSKLRKQFPTLLVQMKEKQKPEEFDYVAKKAREFDMLLKARETAEKELKEKQSKK